VVETNLFSVASDAAPGKCFFGLTWENLNAREIRNLFDGFGLLRLSFSCGAVPRGQCGQLRGSLLSKPDDI
jgi:hypothetical protein